MSRILIIYVVMLIATWAACYFLGVFDIYIGTRFAAILAAIITIGVKYGYIFLAMIMDSWIEEIGFRRLHRQQVAR
jgi:hypothetical protein